MSEFKWTAEQSAAIHAPIADILVAAAAGAGKTQVLTGRIIHRLTADRADISQILVVTFTKAAAAEMRQRIGRAIAEKIAAEPKNLHLRAQKAQLGAAKITTMHSFCLDIIKENFYRLGLDAGFRVAEEAESELLRLEALDEALEELYEEGGDFLLLADCYSSARDDKTLSAMIMDIYRFTESVPNPDEWLAAQEGKYSPDADFNSQPAAREALAMAREKIEGALHIIRRAEKFSEENAELSPYLPMFGEDYRIIDEILQAPAGWDSLRLALEGFSLPRRKIIKGADPEVKAVADALREDAKEAVKSAAALLPYSEAEARETLFYMRPIFLSLSAAVGRFSQKYAQAKRERRLIDFADIEHMCLSLLEENGEITPLARELQGRFKEIFVDEYQDVNKVQEKIFGILSGRENERPNMFMVGDMKQSIYRFRQTSPELFKEKLETYGLSGARRRMRLSLNFRSRPEVLGCVNHVFRQIMSERAGELDYNKEEELYKGAQYPPAQRKGEIHFIDMSEKDSEDLKAAEAEAAFVAQRIREIMADENFTVFDGAQKKERRVKFSDILILMRSTKNKLAQIESVLSAAGLPVYADTGGYFNTIEVSVFLSLLGIIDNPLQDIALIAVLRSPMIGFDEAKLLEIRQKSEAKYFYHALCEAAEGGDEQCAEFLKRLGGWRKIAKALPVDKLIWRLLGETGYYAFVGALPGGEGRQANLRLLFDRARRFEETSFRGLFNFVEFIARMKSANADLGSARILTENQNVIRIMSVHKSKGLEFPVVFLMGAGSRFNFRDSSGRLVIHAQTGIELDCVRPAERIVYPGPFKGLAAERLRRESISEEMRILYVALTRAREKLIVSGAVTNLAEKKARWAALGGYGENAHYILSAGSFLNWLGMCVFKNPGPWEVFTRGASAAVDIAAAGAPAMPAAGGGSGEVLKRLSYSYPGAALSKVPAKLSVTEVKRIMEDADEGASQMYKATTLRKPAFLSGSLSAREKGSALHFVMQHIALHKTKTISDIKLEIERMVQSRLIDEAAARSVDPGRILKFFDSALGKRLKTAEKVYRETPFTMALPASVLTGDGVHAGESVVLQGIIDCWFLEGGRITLVDYKTDFYNEPGEIAEKYKSQIDFYAAALEKKFFKKVGEKYIYLFHKSDIIAL